MSIFSKQDLLELPLSLEVPCGLFKQQKWGINGKLGMLKEFSFGKIIGQVILVLLLSIGISTNSLMRKNKSVASLWDGVCQLASAISFSEEEDSLIYQFSSNGVYNVQSFYKIINFKGVQPVFQSLLSRVLRFLRVQYFLWLLSKNGLLTRDNLNKRKKSRRSNLSLL